LLLVEDACHTSCDKVDALLDVNDVACSCDFICTSCIDLESDILALKKMREDMSAKLVEHDEMSANLEKENEFLHTTYAKCIEEEIDNLINMTCDTCEGLKSENEVLRTRCKSLCAKGLNSHFSCNCDVDASEIASPQLESTSYLERDSLNGSKCASALDSSPIAPPKFVIFSVLPKMSQMARVLLTSLELVLPNRSSIAPFARKMGIPWSFSFVVLSMSDSCVPKLLRSHIAFLISRVFLMWTPSQVC
jgi:hypothetical protein